MVRAVIERRSDRLDEISTENVKLDAKWRKVVTEKIRAEAEREAMEDAMAEQAKMLVDLLGMVGRYTVVLGDASRSLRTALEDGRDGLDGTARVVASSLRTLMEQNDEDFQSLVGHTVASYAAIPFPSTLDGFKGFTRPKRLSSAPSELQSRTKAPRRSSTYGTLGVGTTSTKRPLEVASKVATKQPRIIKYSLPPSVKIRAKRRRSSSGVMKPVKATWMKPARRRCSCTPRAATPRSPLSPLRTTAPFSQRQHATQQPRANGKTKRRTRAFISASRFRPITHSRLMEVRHALAVAADSTPTSSNHAEHPRSAVSTRTMRTARVRRRKGGHFPIVASTHLRSTRHQ